MLELFNDKKNTFECKLELEGSNYSNVKPRLILESSKNKRNLVFNGSVDQNGNCTIPIDYSMDDESDYGNVTMEIVVENTLFTPWESKYSIKPSKKVLIKEVTLTSYEESKDMKIISENKTITENNPTKVDSADVLIENNIRRNEVILEHISKLENSILKLKKYPKQKIIESYIKLNNLDDNIQLQLRKQFGVGENSAS